MEHAADRFCSSVQNIKQMMKVEFKSKRSTTWELRVRIAVKECARCCSCLSSFASAFMDELAKYPRDTTHSIKDSYRAKVIDNYVKVYHWPASCNERVIAIVTEETI